MRFDLSNAQRKELERGTGLLIAIPVPRRDAGDLLAYARGFLAVAPEWIRSVTPGEVDVDPSTFAGTAGLLPAIVGAPISDDHLTLRVRVLIVTLAIGDRRQRTTAKVQWPGGAFERGEVV